MTLIVMDKLSDNYNVVSKEASTWVSIHADITVSIHADITELNISLRHVMK